MMYENCEGSFTYGRSHAKLIRNLVTRRRTSDSSQGLPTERDSAQIGARQTGINLDVIAQRTR